MSWRTVTFLGENELHLEGRQVSVGDEAPDVELAASLTDSYSLLGDSVGKIRLVSVVPSIDTPVCQTQTRNFNEEAAALDDAQVVVLTVSADLPVAQDRWCAADGIENLKMLSDHKAMAFGQAYGTEVKELRLNHRSVFVIDKKDKVTYVEYLDELTNEPDYAAALEAVKALL